MHPTGLNQANHALAQLPYSVLPAARSLRFGLRDGSLESNPKINNETKKIIVVYTKSFKVNI